ncbi:hypothetical protein GOBAR_DD10383 [Gossypium barbadense]|nr:hypothetical protein GOBAR_DD10383 [Gossypium barbadense]
MEQLKRVWIAVISIPLCPDYAGKHQPPSLPEIDLHPLPPNINRSCQQSHVHRFSHVSLPEELIPKLDLAKKHISSQLHVNLPDIEVRQFVATAIILKGLGAILFVFGHGFGALLLFVYLLVSTPLLYDFYNYRPNEPQYSVLLGDFLQCVAQCDALIFFVGMKNSMPKRQLRRKYFSCVLFLYTDSEEESSEDEELPVAAENRKAKTDAKIVKANAGKPDAMSVDESSDEDEETPKKVESSKKRPAEAATPVSAKKAKPVLSVLY